MHSSRLRSRPGARSGDPAPASAPPPLYSVGIINFRAYECLERCLRSVEGQTLPPREVVVVDNDSSSDVLEALRLRHPRVVFKPESNRGFSASANQILAHVREAGSQSGFTLILNPDVELEPDFAERLLTEMMEHPEAALASGKLLRPGNGVIDSAGIVLPRHRRPRDRGSEEEDRGQYELSEFVFGASGAALMIRGAALDDLAIEGEVFDEDFFMYREDTDLAWRAKLLGWRVLYVPDARARHARQWRRDRRFEISPEVRRHSFKNHYLQLIKNERPSDFLLNLPVIIGWEVLRLGFALARDRALLGGYRDAWRHAPSAWKKRRVLHERARDPSRPSAWHRLTSSPSSSAIPHVDRSNHQTRRGAV